MIEKEIIFLLQYKQLLEIQIDSLSKNRHLRKKNKQVLSLLQTSYDELFYYLFGRLD